MKGDVAFKLMLKSTRTVAIIILNISTKIIGLMSQSSVNIICAEEGNFTTD